MTWHIKRPSNRESALERSYKDRPRGTGFTRARKWVGERERDCAVTTTTTTNWRFSLSPWVGTVVAIARN